VREIDSIHKHNTIYVDRIYLFWEFRLALIDYRRRRTDGQALCMTSSDKKQRLYQLHPHKYMADIK